MMIKNCPFCGQATGDIGLYCGCTLETEYKDPNIRLFSVGVLAVLAVFTSLFFISVNSLVGSAGDGIPGLLNRHSNLLKILSAEFVMFSMIFVLRKAM